MIDGTRMPSVTSLLHDFIPEGEGIKRWKDNTPDWKEKMSKAANVGTITHHNIANYLNDKFDLGKTLKPLEFKEPIYPQVEIEACAAMSYFDDFIRHYKVEPLDVELEIYHKQLKYAGTLDFVGMFGGVPSVIDWKTSSSIWPTYQAQVVAYKKAVLSQEEICKRLKIDKIERCVIVVVNQRNGLKVGEVIDENIAWDIFWGAYDRFQELFRPEKRIEKHEVI
jgi:hypothetical protein